MVHLPTELAKRTAALAVSRYGADRIQVRRAYQAMLQAQAQGIDGDLLDMLVVQKLLTPTQAADLRHALTHESPAAETDVAASMPADAPPIAPDIEFATPPPGGTAADVVPKNVQPTRSGYYLRNIGDYRLLRRLGEGGMGTVYLGYNEAEGRHVAIKVLADRLASNRANVVRFHREAKSGTLLDHPNIVRCLSAGRDQPSGKHYLVMEYVEGPSARALLDQHGRLTVGDAVRIALEVARALEYAHGNHLVHRDIKPDNILIGLDGVAKLADLGLAKFTGGGDSSQLTTGRQGFGTPFYMPCEQAMDAKQADARCDIYALGATLYHLATGQVPFPGETHVQIAEKKLAGVFPPASRLNPQVPELLDRILSKMLARDPADRYQKASELVVVLEASGLASPVPSFLHPGQVAPNGKAPVAASSSQPTRMDLGATPPREPETKDDPELWYLRYREGDGPWCKARASTEQILERLRAELRSAAVEVSRQPQGDYKPAAEVDEFRAAVAQPAPVPPAPTPAAPHPAETVVPAPERSGNLVNIIVLMLGVVMIAAGITAAFLVKGR